MRFLWLFSKEQERSDSEHIVFVNVFDFVEDQILFYNYEHIHCEIQKGSHTFS